MRDAPIIQTITPTTHDLGDFRVHRSLPAKERTMVGPFIFFDQAGPARIAAGQGVDVLIPGGDQEFIPIPQGRPKTVSYPWSLSCLY